MFKRPQSGETEEDILRMQEEFLKEKQKNPKVKPAAKCIRLENSCKQSLFAKERQQKQQRKNKVREEEEKGKKSSPNSNLLYDEIHKKIVADVDVITKEKSKEGEKKSFTELIIGDIIERSIDNTQNDIKQSTNTSDISPFPNIEKISIPIDNQSCINNRTNRSLFAQALASKSNNQIAQQQKVDNDKINEYTNVEAICGPSSVIVEDVQTAEMVHKENLIKLKQMTEKDIMEERQKLLKSLDPSLVNLLAKKRKEKTMQTSRNITNCTLDNQAEPMDYLSPPQQSLCIDLNDLPDSNPAKELIQRSSEENWLNFNVVEKDKLKWMHDINLDQSTIHLTPGEKFEARFDWKGILLPYQNTDINMEKDERELYLHGVEPERPGYTLQELFRLARSNVMQQRLAAFNAIAGILNIYQQGFYDQVLELPVAKIFFLLRYGFDDNTQSMLEVVGKALSYLFYNETDEILLDFCYDNPGCHWQPVLQVLHLDNTDDDDPCSIENLQKQIQQLEVSQQMRTNFMSSAVQESDEETKTSMSDFQLAETDLIECFLRTNILQRIYFILNTIKPENSTVISCLKLLIRLARSGKDVALKIANNEELMICLYENFLPGLEKVDITAANGLKKFYNYPQYLLLKLLRILISTQLDIALKILNKNLSHILENYLFNREDIKSPLIKVQIECLRILRCLFLLRCDHNLYKTFLPAFRYMLDWHFNHVIYEEIGPFLIRQHAAALLATIAAIPGDVFDILDITTTLRDILSACCCKWFQNAKRFGVTEFSQLTLLNCCLNIVIWYTRHNGWDPFQSFLKVYLKEFVETELPKSLKDVHTSSILLHNDAIDRRNVFKALPNVGSILLHKQGPHLIIPQKYPIHLLTTLWRLMELLLEQNNRQIFDVLLTPSILEPLIKYLSLIGKRCNRYLSTNFFVKTELNLIDKLLSFHGIETYFEISTMFQIAYNFLCCLTADYIPEIEKLFEKIIFNSYFLRGIEKETLKKWHFTFLEMVYDHYIIVSPNELTLSLPFNQTPILSPDWPYYQLKLVLQNYIDNVQYKSNLKLSEHEILQMTLNFVGHLDVCINDTTLKIVTPTEKLMYYMICFMGYDTEFLQKEMHDLLQKHLNKFYKECENIQFDFEKVYQGKCKYENLYALFVEHFQAASYGDELFGSLVMVPLAQKYNNKWRRRIWSDYAGTLRFLNCSETLLIGGLNSYLVPLEDDASLLKAYRQALDSNLVRINSIPYKIAKHHVDKALCPANTIRIDTD